MRTDRSAKPGPGARRLGRKARKGDLDFNYALGDGIDLLNPEHWDAAVAGQSLFLDRDFCRLMEHAGPRSVRHRYGMVYRKDAPVAAVAVRIAPLREAAVPLAERLPRRARRLRLVSRPEDLAMEDSWQPAARAMMICGDLYAGGFHGVGLRDGEDIARLWPAISSLLAKIQAKDGLSRDKDFILIKDVPAMPASDTRTLRQQQYRRFDTSPNMVLDIPSRCTTYEDYLAQMNVRHRLVAHRAARELYRQGYESRPVDDLAPWSSRIHELYTMVQRRSGSSRVPLPKDLLPALASQLSPSMTRCSALFQGEEMAGFAVTLKDRDTAVCYAAGWDTGDAHTLPLLPPLLHSVVRDALAMGCRHVNFGRTALRMKAQLGAHPEQTELWIQHARAELGLPVATLLETISHAPAGDAASPLPV